MTEKKETITEAVELKGILAEFLAQQNNSDGKKETGRKGRREYTDYKIISVQIPTRVKDRRENCKVTITCEADLKTIEDLFDLLVQLEDNGITPDWWPDKSYSNSRGRGCQDSNDSYRRRR